MCCLESVTTHSTLFICDLLYNSQHVLYLQAKRTKLHDHYSSHMLHFELLNDHDAQLVGHFKFGR